MADDVPVSGSAGSRSRSAEEELFLERDSKSRETEVNGKVGSHTALSKKKDILLGEGEREGAGEEGEDKEISKPLQSCLVLSLSFFAVFTGYMAIQNLITSLNQAQGLGVTSLACLYGTIIASGFAAPSFLGLVGAKRCMLLAWGSHLLYTLSNFYPTWATLVPASLLLGWMSAPMWTCQGLYLSACSSAYSAARSAPLHAALSRLNGVFFTLFAFTQITGNLISSLLLTRGTASNATNAHCGPWVCPDLAADNTSTITLARPDPPLVYGLMGTFLGCQAVGLLLTAVWLPPLKRPADSEAGGVRGALQACVSCCRALSQPRLLLLLPSFMGQAMAMGILLTEYTKSYISCTVGISQVGFVMAVYGGVNAVSALLLGRLARYTGRLPLFVAANLIDLGCLTTMLLWTPSHEHFALLFLLPALAGVADGILQTQNNSLIALVFPDTKTQSYAVYHTSKATGFTLTFVCGVFLCVTSRLYLALALYASGFLGYLLVECLVVRDRKASQRQLSDAAVKQ